MDSTGDAQASDYGGDNCVVDQRSHLHIGHVMELLFAVGTGLTIGSAIVISALLWISENR